MDEVERIRAEYARRAETIPKDFYSLTRPANLFAYQQKNRLMMKLLADEGLIPLEGKRILDVGCGEGQQLIELESWGASREALAGIDLLESRVLRARARLSVQSGGSGGADIRHGDASKLPWPDTVFDIAHQGAVFTSITDGELKKTVAREILRVLKPGGVLIWYDFLFDNPNNPNVKGISAREIRALFPGCGVHPRRTTLAPPLARRLVPITWIGSLILEKLVILNTHYLAIIRTPSRHRRAGD